jgi:hypothetical protein
MEVCQYTADKKNEWDNFIENSKNGTFMLKRDYMDYHADRFKDFSVMVYDDGKLLSVMPASLHENGEVRSHGGLTYGGFITDRKMTTPKMLGVFEAVKNFFVNAGVKKVIYKRVPSIYYSYPSDEDLYALFINNASLVRRDIGTTVYQKDKIPFNERRRRNIKKAVKAELITAKSDDYDTYMDMLTDVLANHHNAKPVHTSAEIKMLAGRFPENISLWAAYDGQEMLAGIVIYETPLVAHCQYIANSERGRNVGALDLVVDYLINDIYTDKAFFDFGISNEQEGRYLNVGLVGQKQEFGGRAVAYDFYEWSL